MPNFQQYLAPNRGSLLSGGAYAPPTAGAAAHFGRLGKSMVMNDPNQPNSYGSQLARMGGYSAANPYGNGPDPLLSRGGGRTRSPYDPPDTSWRTGIDERILGYLDGEGKHLWEKGVGPGNTGPAPGFRKLGPGGPGGGFGATRRPIGPGPGYRPGWGAGPPRPQQPTMHDLYRQWAQKLQRMMGQYPGQDPNFAEWSKGPLVDPIINRGF